MMRALYLFDRRSGTGYLGGVGTELPVVHSSGQLYGSHLPYHAHNSKPQRRRATSVTTKSYHLSNRRSQHRR